MRRRGEEAATLGYDFLAKHITDTGGELFFAVTRDGRPLERFFFSVEAYAMMACAAYSTAAKDEKAWGTPERVTAV